MKFEYRIKEKQMHDTNLFMIRIYKLCKWLRKRYNLKGDVIFYYGYIRGQIYSNTITIRLTFY